MTSYLNIIEFFTSIQGESSFAGFPFFFIRFAGCNLKCNYCDTQYANNKNNFKKIKFKELCNYIKKTWCKYILFTGGEPLLQENIYQLIDYALKINKKVLIETNGSVLIDKIPKQAIKILDLKTPGSQMESFNNYDNIKYLNKTDEVKFVVTDKKDFEWSVDLIFHYNLQKKIKNILFSPALNLVSPIELSEWIIDKKINVRLQLQLHKIIGCK